MCKIAAIITSACLLANVVDATDLRLYFSKQGDTSGIPAEWTAASTPTYGPGDQKIYLWAATEKTGTAWDIWHGVAVDIDQTVTAGVAYNPEIPELEFVRWHKYSDLSWTDGDGMFGSSFYEDGLGSVFDPLMVPGSPQRHFLVAELSFPTTSTYDAYLVVGSGGIARKGGAAKTDKIYFGFGDAGLLGDAKGAKSALPDVHVVPEPSGLALFGLMVLMLRRR